MLHLSRAAFVWKIGLPNAVPDIVAGMRLSLTVALILAVIGEMLSGQEGLGTAILLAARAFRAPELYAGIALLGVIGLISSYGLLLAERRIVKWRPNPWRPREPLLPQRTHFSCFTHRLGISQNVEQLAGGTDRTPPHGQSLLWRLRRRRRVTGYGDPELGRPLALFQHLPRTAPGGSDVAEQTPAASTKATIRG